jgi:hypothetical protein
MQTEGQIICELQPQRAPCVVGESAGHVFCDDLCNAWMQAKPLHGTTMSLLAPEAVLSTYRLQPSVLQNCIHDRDRCLTRRDCWAQKRAGSLQSAGSMG